MNETNRANKTTNCPLKIHQSELVSKSNNLLKWQCVFCLLRYIAYRISVLVCERRTKWNAILWHPTDQTSLKKKKKTEHTNANGKESRREMEMRIINKIGRNISNEGARERQRVRDIWFSIEFNGKTRLNSAKTITLSVAIILFYFWKRSVSILN